MSFVKKMEDDKISFLDGEEVFLWMDEIPKENNVVEIIIGGELRSETAHDIADEINALISVGMNLIIDMKDVTYISSAHMKDLISFEMSVEKKNKSMTIRSLKPKIEEQFKKTGAIDLLMIE